MKIDLNADSKMIRAFIEERMNASSFSGVGEPAGPGCPITQVTLGYYLGDGAGWVALVFDTRPNATNDGDWSRALRDKSNLLYVSHWREAGDALFEEQKIVVLFNERGARANKEISTEAELVQLVGEMLKQLVLQLRDEGVFRGLPLAEDAFINIEDFGGDYGWPYTYEAKKIDGRIGGSGA